MADGDSLMESKTQRDQKPLRIYGVQGTEVKGIPSLQLPWDGVSFTYTGSLQLRNISTQAFMSPFPEM